MLLRPEYLSQNLDRPLPTKDGGTLSTIGEACDYMTNMGRDRRRVAKETAETLLVGAVLAVLAAATVFMMVELLK
jgi:hypothetical protein